MVLDVSLLNTPHYKVRIKGKVEKSWERRSALGVVAIEKGAFGSFSTMVANFSYLLNLCDRKLDFIVRKDIEFMKMFLVSFNDV